MTPIVTRRQLCEHLTDYGLWAALFQSGEDWDMMIVSKRESLSGQYIRLDRAPGGFVVHHGKYRELKALVIR